MTKSILVTKEKLVMKTNVKELNSSNFTLDYNVPDEP